VIQYGCPEDLKVWSGLSLLGALPWQALPYFHAVYQDLSHVTHTEIKVSFAHCTMGNFQEHKQNYKYLKPLFNIYSMQYRKYQTLLVKNKLLNTK
jgi:hypothetical protein